MTTIEILGAIFGLLAVWLSARANVWCWPASLVNTALFMILFAGARLYGDLLTNAVFFVMSAYGWVAWARGARGDGLRIHHASLPVRLACGAIIAVATPLCGWSFATFTDGAYPYPEGAILAASLVAQALLTRKIVESWPLWVAVDVVAVLVYLWRGLYVTAGLYVVFLGIALHGWRTWRRLA